MSRLTSKPLVIRLALLIAALLVLAALAYGLRIHVVGDPPARDLAIVDGTAAAAPRPAPGPTPVLVTAAAVSDPNAATRGGTTARERERLARSPVSATALPCAIATPRSPTGPALDDVAAQT
ncbi:hypothetical protein K7957_15400 [Sphingomonas yunnanensis]|uniref:hypothetical protein n=1 Tax=Sphingomonas yunnanensis TaxID=310400 RepID=UPI001CA6FE48|nr:hypothetical protein [Sphingomonas yunnanensis]MBY9064324.1 hypothetical protein [Sphingomonas yunnanensis]